MYRGRIRFELPMMWTVSFMLTFTIGGMTGVMLAVPAADFVLHNSLFLTSHFHNVIIGGVLFGLFAGFNYWFPKMFGFKLNRFWGVVSFWLWSIGFWVAFLPGYILGFMGVTRRSSHFEDPELQPLFVISFIGTVMIAAAIGALLMQIYASWRDRKKNVDLTGDPWDGRTLEWATSSPPPDYNFAFTPVVYDNDTFADMKKNGWTRPLKDYVAIHMPKNTWAGFVISALSMVVGFAIIWHMWLLTGLAFFAMLVAIIVHTFNYKRDYYISADEVTRTENARTKLLEAHV
jgi:cytochrome o ubiquinol oxidase subunit 1